MNIYFKGANHNKIYIVAQIDKDSYIKVTYCVILGYTSKKIKMDQFILDAETFRKLQPVEYLRKFTRENTRPDGRPFNKSRPTTIATGIYRHCVYKRCPSNNYWVFSS